jgi:hypothetical protein
MISCGVTDNPALVTGGKTKNTTHNIFIVVAVIIFKVSIYDDDQTISSNNKMQ